MLRMPLQPPLPGVIPPNLDLRFGVSLPSIVSFTRATPATSFDSAGVLQTAASGVARVGSYVYDGANWINRGLLIEEARIWRALWNRDFTNAAWVKSNMGTAKDAIGLDEVANSATTLTATDANATVLQTVTISSAAFTYSIYVKRVTGSGDIDITDNNGANWTTLTGLSTSLWTRHDITRTQANPVFGVRIVTDTDAVEVDFAGLEPGAFLTSPNATTTAAITRNADVVTSTISAIPGFRQSQGTILVEANIPVFSGAFDYLFQIDDGGNTDRIRLVNNGGTLQGSTINSSGNNGDSTIATITAGTSFRAIMAFVQDDVIVGLAGAVDATPDTSADLPTADPLTTLRIGANHQPVLINGYIARIALWNRRLPNAILQYLTQ